MREKKTAAKEAADGTIALPEKLDILDITLRRLYHIMAKLNDEELKSQTFQDLMRNMNLTESRIRVLREETAPEKAAPIAPAETEDDAAPAETALTKTEVRARLLDLSGKYDKLDIAALMESLGYCA